MSVRKRVANLALVLVAALLLGLVGTANAHAAPPPITAPITNLDTGVISSDHRPDLIAQRHQTRVYLDAGTYTYGQTYDGILTHDQTALIIPTTGTYTLHDAIHDGLGGKVHLSYLDPAPDPTDPTRSGVILTHRPLPTTAKTLEWGSLLIRTR